MRTRSVRRTSVADGDLAETDGQFRFDFSEDAEPMRLPGGRPEVTVAQWRDLAHEQETEGLLADAGQSYRTALAVGGADATISFELAHLLAELGEKEAAVERYRQVVEMDPQWGDAWNNLGVLLCELTRHEDGVAAFHRALEIDLDDHRAHYNLADALDECGRCAEAKPHWSAYLKSEPSGAWAAHARKCLA